MGRDVSRGTQGAEPELNTGLPPEIVELVAGKIDWKLAPVWAGAYIAVCVEHDPEHSTVDNSFPRVETVGCWVMHDSHQRRAAPAFGIEELAPGESCIILRPGSQWDAPVMLWLRLHLEHHRWPDRHQELLPPEPGWKPPPPIYRRPLFVAIGRSLALQQAAREIAQARRGVPSPSTIQP